MNFTQEMVSILSYPIDPKLVDEMMEIAKEIDRSSVTSGAVTPAWCREVIAQLRMNREDLLKEWREICNNSVRKDPNE